MRLAALLFAIASAAWAMEQKDVEFARPDGKPLTLDIHVPEGAGPFAAAVVVHGGGFDQGTKRSYVGPVLEVLEQAGYAWFSIDYRMAPAYHFPEPVEDVNSAIRWVKKNAAQYHVDPNRIALIGESAGAYLITYAATHASPETKTSAVVDFYGPVDYAKQVELRRDHPERFDMVSANRHAANGGGMKYFGVDQADAAGMNRLREISPLNAVHPGIAPFLIIHGDHDDQVAYEESPVMCDKLRRMGNRCELITVEGGKHGMGNWKDSAQQHWKTDLVAWLRKTLR